MKKILVRGKQVEVPFEDRRLQAGTVEEDVYDSKSIQRPEGHSAGIRGSCIRRHYGRSGHKQL